MTLGVARRWLGRLPLVVAALAVVGFYVGFGLHYHRTAMMAPDESFYTVAAARVMEGEVPYRDFAYTQTPIYPYIDGALMSVFGFSMASHRAINVVWGAVGLAVLVFAVRRRTGKWEPALLTGFLLAASPRWMSLQAMGVWCGPTGAFLNAALAAVIIEGRFWPRLMAFAVFGTVATGCRLSCAPVVAVLFAAMAFEAGGWRRASAALGACLAVAALSFGPFFLADPSNFVFHVWGYHMGAAFERNFEAQAMQWWNVAPAALVALAVGAMGVARHARERRVKELFLLAAGIVGVVTPMIPSSAWGVYIAAGAPIAAAAGVVSFWAAGGGRSPLRFAAWSLPALSLLVYLPIEVPEGAAAEVEQVAAFVRNEVEAGPLMTPAGIVAVEAGRGLIPGTEMGTFSAMSPDREEEARRRKMTTLPGLTESLERGEPAAVVKMIDPPPWRVWNWRWVLPSLDDQPVDEIHAFEDTLSECYEPVMNTSTMEVHVLRETLDL